MPYFVYEIGAGPSPRRLDCFEQYREARRAVRERRRALLADTALSVRMVFAANESQALELLLQKREPRPLGEDA
jgi:hypothetical protein